MGHRAGSRKAKIQEIAYIELYVNSNLIIYSLLNGLLKGNHLLKNTSRLKVTE